jgi:hypothetical protein
MSRRGRLLRAVLLCGLALAACGGSEQEPETAGQETAGTAAGPLAPDPAGPRPLSPAGIRVMQRAREEVSAYCGRVARALAEGEGPTAADFERVTAALDRLGTLAAQQPGAEAEHGTTPRLALGDIAENLEGTNCDPRLVARIDEALAELPAE